MISKDLKHLCVNSVLFHSSELKLGRIVELPNSFCSYICTCTMLLILCCSSFKIIELLGEHRGEDHRDDHPWGFVVCHRPGTVPRWKVSEEMKWKKWKEKEKRQLISQRFSNPGIIQQSVPMQEVVCPLCIKKQRVRVWMLEWWMSLQPVWL